jgi:hypothetical protein
VILVAAKSKIPFPLFYSLCRIYFPIFGALPFPLGKEHGCGCIKVSHDYILCYVSELLNAAIPNDQKTASFGSSSFPLVGTCVYVIVALRDFSIILSEHSLSLWAENP